MQQALLIRMSLTSDKSLTEGSNNTDMHVSLDVSRLITHPVYTRLWFVVRFCAYSFKYALNQPRL
jgi:hypothetical protein